MRRHLYLITDHPNDDLVGRVEAREKPYVVAEKNKVRDIMIRNHESGERYTIKVVSLGYYDFESDDPDNDTWKEAIQTKLGEVDTDHLERAGVDPQEATA